MDNADIERGAPPAPPAPSLAAVLRHNSRTYIDGAVAVVLFFVWQLLICGLQQLTPSIDDFPAAILAMILVAATMILASKFFANLDHLYLRYLRGPTDLINRHMSIGFTVPFAMIMQGPMSSPRNVAIIIAGFIITGVLNTFFVFGISMVVQSALMAIPLPRSRSRSRAVPPLVHRGTATIAYPVLAPPALAPLDLRPPATPDPHRGRIRSCVSESTTLTNSNSPPIQSEPENILENHIEPEIESQIESQNEKTRPRSALPTAARAAALRLARTAAAHPVLCFCVAAIPAVGIPVSAATGNDAPLDSFVLFALWTGMLAAQAAVKTARRRVASRAVRNVVSTLLNAVLWSSLGAIAYLAAKAAARHRPLDAELRAFSTGTTLADVMAGSSNNNKIEKHRLGAGDIASSVLNAGIVSWGLKLFECRNQLLSRAGATTLIVGAVIAVGNIVCGPLLVHAMRLAPRAKVLSFAARSVTLALAGPAMKNLGGDVGLNAAMVVFNGIVFQVAMGLGLYRWVGVKLAQTAARLSRGVPGQLESDTDTESDSDADSRRSSRSDVDTLHDRAPSAMSTASASSASSSGSDDAIIKAVLSVPGAAAHGPSAADHAAGAALALSPSYSSRHSRHSRHSAFIGHMRGGGDVDAGVDNEAASFFSSKPDSASTVSAGMTIGINAAAMGTAYLYEDGSRSAPYAVLSMTVFGVMTVVFTSIQPLAAWVISTVS